MSTDTPFRMVNGIYAFIATGTDGDEGIVGFRASDGTWMPLIGSDNIRVQLLWDIAQSIATETKSSIALCKFSNRDEVAVLSPGGTAPCPI